MRFWKMNGAGNDFIIINNMVEHLPETCFPTLARTLCERHLSIGADGLMIEVHNDPIHALCDGAQSLTPAQFADVAARVRQIRAVVEA